MVNASDKQTSDPQFKSWPRYQRKQCTDSSVVRLLDSGWLRYYLFEPCRRSGILFFFIFHKFGKTILNSDGLSVSCHNAEPLYVQSFGTAYHLGQGLWIMNIASPSATTKRLRNRAWYVNLDCTPRKNRFKSKVVFTANNYPKLAPWCPKFQRSHKWKFSHIGS